MVSRRRFLLGAAAFGSLPVQVRAAAPAPGQADHGTAGHAGHAGHGGLARAPKPSFNASAALDAQGGVCAVFKDGNHVAFCRASAPGARWSLPVRVNALPESVAADGDARPKLALGPDGEVYVSWTKPLARPYTGDIRFARSLDGGASFLPPLTVHTDRQEITHRFDALAVAADGQVVLAWIDKRDLERAKAAGRDYRGAAVYFAASADRGASFPIDHRLADHSCECCRIALLPRRDGGLTALWRQVFAPNIRDHALADLWPDGRSTPLQRASFENWAIDACPHHGPALAEDGDGRLHAVWFADGAVRYGVLGEANVAAPTAVPVPARRVGGPAAEHADLAAQGRDLVIAWREFDGTATRLMAERSRDGGATWATAVLAQSLGPTGQPQVLARGGRFWVFWHGRDEPLRLIEVGT